MIFKKNKIPWNKGKKCEKISLAKLGKKRPDMVGNKLAVRNIPWNKGRKYSFFTSKSIVSSCKICNSSFRTTPYKVTHGEGKCCGKECADKLRRITCSQLCGDKHYRWVADRSKIKIGERKKNDTLQKEWRKTVKDRDKWLCCLIDENCEKRLEAHHIYSWTRFPLLRYKVSNGITLCHFHHPRKRKDEERLIPLFKELVSLKSI